MLNENNIVLEAMHNYDNPSATVEEFESDLKRLMYIKKLIIRYASNGDLKERLLLNHIIVLYNVFGNFATELLFYKIEKKYWNILGTFLIYLRRMPEELPEYGLYISDITPDEHLVNTLRKL